MDFKEDLKWLISLLFPIIYNEVKEWLKNKKKTTKP